MGKEEPGPAFKIGGKQLASVLLIRSFAQYLLHSSETVLARAVLLPQGSWHLPFGFCQLALTLTFNAEECPTLPPTCEALPGTGATCDQRWRQCFQRQVVSPNPLLLGCSRPLKDRPFLCQQSVSCTRSMPSWGPLVAPLLKGSQGSCQYGKKPLTKGAKLCHKLSFSLQVMGPSGSPPHLYLQCHPLREGGAGM